MHQQRIPQRINATNWIHWSAILGGAVWLTLAVITAAGYGPLGLTEQLFLLAPLVVVPLGMGLAVEPGSSLTSRGILFEVAAALQPLGAGLAVLSFCVPTGDAAGWLGAGWLLVTVLAGVSGLRIFRRNLSQVAEMCADAGLLYLPVGGIWLVLTRLGETPFELTDTIVLLTAVHFHFSGFAACLLAGALGRALASLSPAAYPLYRFAAAGVVAGTFLIAMGFLLSPLLKVVMILLFALSLIALGGLTAFVLPRIADGLARGFLGVSVVSLWFGMVLAAAYGIGEFQGELLISIPQMAQYHGVLNGLGFCLGGLMGWTLAGAAVAVQAARYHVARPSVPVAERKMRFDHATET